MIDTILFDLEGVIVDTENTVWVPSVTDFLQRRDITYHREIIQPLMMGRTMKEGVEIMQNYYGFPGDIDELVSERRAITKEYFQKNIDFIPGFVEFFATIQNKYKAAVASSIDREYLKLVNRKLNLPKFFGDQIYIIQDVNFVSKPNPDIFLYAAKKVNSLPKTCLVIEDAPHGIEAAKRANMKCIALATSVSKTKLQNADYIVDSYTEINLNQL